MVHKGILILATSLLICSCSGDITIPDMSTLYSDMKTEQPSNLNIKEIEMGKAFSLDQIANVSILDDKFKKLYDVEYGEFFSIKEGNEEAVYKYGNMAVNVKGNQGAIMQIVGIPANLKIKYDGLLIDNGFKPKKLSVEKFEVDVHKATALDNTIGIESTNIKTVYDTQYSIRERVSDDLLYVYFLDNKLVAIEVLIQC